MFLFDEDVGRLGQLLVVVFLVQHEGLGVHFGMAVAAVLRAEDVIEILLAGGGVLAGGHRGL